MTDILFLYSTIDGHTIAICERLAKQAEGAGLSALIRDISACSEAELACAGMIVIGASIRYGHHRPFVTRFIRHHRNLLESRPNAFFSVNVVARKPEKNRPETNPYLVKFLRQISWRPERLAVFAGRLDYPRCGFIDRQLIRLIMWITKGPTDPKGVFEFTDWARVEAFGRELIDAARQARQGA